MRREVSIAAALICAGCAPLSAGPRHFAEARSLCDVVQNEQTYAGQRILVRGLLVQTPHGRLLHSPECDGSAELRSSSEFWDRRARLVVEAAQANNIRPSIPVVISGVFHPCTRYENGQRTINVGGPFIEDARIVAARQP